MEHGYWGPSFDDAAIGAALDAERCSDRGARLRPPRLGRRGGARRVDGGADCRGRVVGWYQGRMEWGSRALGNRSIVADPRRADMREIINTRIKFRERFRPFAPSVLEEALDDYFVGAVPDPFMLQVYPVRPDKRALVPAITHVDGSGRLQTVSPRSNPRYYRLIKSFERPDRRADAAQHLVQRERADRADAGAGARLLPANAHGCARHGAARARARRGRDLMRTPRIETRRGHRRQRIPRPPCRRRSSGERLRGVWCRGRRSTT